MPAAKKTSIEMGTKLDAWELFLEARVTQEKGELGSAIVAFDRALAIDPTNPNFLKAKAAALTVANYFEAGVVAEVAKEYERLTQTYVGADDKPDLWIKELNKLENRIENGRKEATAIMARKGISDTVAIVW